MDLLGKSELSCVLLQTANYQLVVLVLLFLRSALLPSGILVMSTVDKVIQWAQFLEFIVNGLHS